MTASYSHHASFPYSVGSVFKELQDEYRTVASYIYLGYKEDSHNPHHFIRIDRMNNNFHYLIQFSLHYPKHVVEKNLMFCWWEKDDELTHVRPTSSTLKTQKERNVIKNAAQTILNEECPSIPFHLIRSEILSYI